MAWDTLVRRSILITPLLDREAVADSWRHGADAVALDLEGLPESAKEEGRTRVRVSLDLARQGGAEIFVKIDRDQTFADIEASAWPGLTGIMLPSPETPADISKVGAMLEEIERRHGIASGALQIVLLVGTAKGIWNIRELLSASHRVSSVAIDEIQLCVGLGIMPEDDCDAFGYAKGRLIIEATAARVHVVGTSHPLGARPRLLEAPEIHRLVERGRNMGFKGVLCPHPSWVKPCNQAFTPTHEQIDYYGEVRRLFAEGVARGTAAVPLNGRMIDVPVDERAKLMIALSERCRKREAEKAAALTTTEVA